MWNVFSIRELELRIAPVFPDILDIPGCESGPNRG
jgi:hypothetical protein